MKAIKLILLLLWGVTVLANDGSGAKTLEAVKVVDEIRIDGRLDEMAWSSASAATGFINFQPVPGEVPSQSTEVKVLYNDAAVYIGAWLHDSDIEGLLREFSLRDDDRANADQFTVIIDTYQGQQTGSSFAVMASGVQVDAQVFNGEPSEDKNWDVVWESRVYIDDNGWYVEMRIPYSALRFPERDVQTWNINFTREIRRERVECSWFPYDPQRGPLLQQMGQLRGIENVEPPTRISLTPYLANVLVNNYDPSGDPVSEWTNQIGGGLDLKYGINQAFTLDMTLIPDFSEVQSDDAVLNLGPFEVAFDENRPFFTEGTELFNKNDLFYSRRVGGRPFLYNRVEDQLEEGEEIVENPRVAQLINATKLTGRTNNGLGIGFFNAVEGESFAIIRDEIGSKRKFRTSPLTNYNMVIFDQLLDNGSNIYGMNTNVYRAGSFYDANVTAVGMNLKNRQQSYGVSGFGGLSQIYESDQTDLGYAYQASFDKISGNWTGGLEMNIASDNYRINDMGLLLRANERTYSFDVNYTDYDGFGKFARVGAGINSDYSRLFDPDVFADFAINWDIFMLMRSFDAFGIEGRLEPVDTYDYFDPRTPDFSRYLLYPENYTFQAFVSSDYRKTLALDARIGTRLFDAEGRYNLYWRFAPRIRFNNHFNLIASVSYEKLFQDRGYTTSDNTQIIMGDRDRSILINTINARYIFTANLGIALRLRHYWSTVSYNEFYELNEDSELVETAYDGFDEEGNTLHDVSQSFFNMDCVLRWRFAPGSDLLFTWKTAIVASDDMVEDNYWQETISLTDVPIRNSFTLKVLYFFDWAQLTNW